MANEAIQVWMPTNDSVIECHCAICSSSGEHREKLEMVHATLGTHWSVSARFEGIVTCRDGGVLATRFKADVAEWLARRSRPIVTSSGDSGRQAPPTCTSHPVLKSHDSWKRGYRSACGPSSLPSIVKTAREVEGPCRGQRIRGWVAPYCAFRNVRLCSTISNCGGAVGAAVRGLHQPCILQVMI